jgi:hypothetical protein
MSPTLTDLDATIAGRLLILSQSADETLDRSALGTVADHTARFGAAYGRGMLEGLWYLLGNTRDERRPYGFQPTWNAGRDAFGITYAGSVR